MSQPHEPASRHRSHNCQPLHVNAHNLLEGLFGVLHWRVQGVVGMGVTV